MHAQQFAEAAVELARQKLARDEKLVDRRFVSPAKIDESTAQYAQARAQLAADAFQLASRAQVFEESSLRNMCEGVGLEDFDPISRGAFQMLTFGAGAAELMDGTSARSRDRSERFERRWLPDRTHLPIPNKRTLHFARTRFFHRVCYVPLPLNPHSHSHTVAQEFQGVR